MSTTRIQCTRCGFEVEADNECPLCGQPVTESSVSTVLNALFGD